MRTRPPRPARFAFERFPSDGRPPRPARFAFERFPSDAVVRFLDAPKDSPFAAETAFALRLTEDNLPEVRRDCSVREPLEYTMIKTIPMRRVRVRPRPPPRGKRKGTRKQWKRANPPHWDVVAAGPIMMLKFPKSKLRILLLEAREVL